jgi:amino acid transporter
MPGRLTQFLFGRRKDIRDPGIFHRIALIPFLAWVGLGADGLSSSAYGPDEAYRALGDRTYLTVGLALATGLTVFIISYAYSRIIEHFPYGGGGYVVASKLLGHRAGVVSGCALLVDYILTITVSVASGADAIVSSLPLEWRAHAAPYKLGAEIAVVLLLVLVNLRGVKESVIAVMPIFLFFLATHVILIGWGVLHNTGQLPEVARHISTSFHRDLDPKVLGLGGMFFLFLRAYSLGGGTYTGIEAVSNGLAIMRDPKVETGKRTMVYMAVSLAVTAGGILVCYLLAHVQPVADCDPSKPCWKTMNAILAENVTAHWPHYLGRVFVLATLFAEGALLFIAAQTGFIDGPRVMANMASDSWLPHRFAALSDRLTTQNGVLLMGGAAIALLIFTGGSVDTLVVMYSINVFATFSLSNLGMSRFWIMNRREHKDWTRHIAVHLIGFTLCVSILVMTMIEKFLAGGWGTLVITAVAVFGCILIRNHYLKVRRSLRHLDQLFASIPTDPKKEELGPCDPQRPTAALFVTGYNGLGVHSVLTLLRMFPKQFTNMVFISVGAIDSGNFKGVTEVEVLKKRTREELGKYVGLARRLGLSAEFRFNIGTDVIDEACKLAIDVVKEFPNTLFFSGKLIFEEPKWYHRLLHNETAYAIQHRLQFAGHPMVILPVRVRARELERAQHDDDPPDDLPSAMESAS